MDRAAAADDGSAPPRGPFAVDQDRALAELELAWSEGGYHGFTAGVAVWLEFAGSPASRTFTVPVAIRSLGWRLGAGLDGAARRAAAVWPPRSAAAAGRACSQPGLRRRDPSLLTVAQAAVRVQEDCLLGLSLGLDSAGVFMHEALECLGGRVGRGERVDVVAHVAGAVAVGGVAQYGAHGRADRLGVALGWPDDAARLGRVLP
jgi:hypothetical protein